MNYKKIVTGRLDVNTYVISASDDSCIIIDPSDGCRKVIDYIQEKSLYPKAILLTHGHFDHIMGIPEIRSVGQYGDIPVYIHTDDTDRLIDPALNGSAMIGERFSLTDNIALLEEGVMKIGEAELRVLHVPGHTMGGCAFLFDDVCFCGDTIFASSVGRTDLGGGNFNMLMKSIREKILTLPPETVLCPGHGGRTTVHKEADTNPYLS